jgi:hypothetical protein
MRGGLCIQDSPGHRATISLREGRALMSGKGTTMGGIIKPWEIVAWLLGLFVVLLIDRAKARNRRLLVLDRFRKTDASFVPLEDLAQLELFDKSADEDLIPEPKPEAAWWRQGSKGAGGLLRRSA